MSKASKEKASSRLERTTRLLLVQFEDGGTSVTN
ncbi:hypothetical protein L914_03126 [Phytophthora nicotianae]|uniref:Uncharacterized protein n=1 Tax=Phytophthora nicotianae TaxID=4792 RepID=W2NY47_PHYNI|nr:hypothetical protein L914_03126 [Phytophthora nicotianae]